MLIQADQSVLLVIDIQQRLQPAIDQGDQVVANATWLVDVAREIGVPIIATEQYPGGLGVTVSPLRERFQDGEIRDKIHFSAVRDGLLEHGAAAERRQWIVVGTETHVCVLQTVLDLLAAGREVFVVADAVGSRLASNRELGLQRMARHGADIVSREMVAFEWLSRAGTPLFREINQRFIR